LLEAASHVLAPGGGGPVGFTLLPEHPQAELDAAVDAVERLGDLRVAAGGTCAKVVVVRCARTEARRQHGTVRFRNGIDDACVRGTENDPLRTVPVFDGVEAVVSDTRNRASRSEDAILAPASANAGRCRRSR